MDDLKEEIVLHLAELSNLKVTANYDQMSDPDDEEFHWDLHEDENKVQESEWITKEATGARLGTITLRNKTKLYFTPHIKAAFGKSPNPFHQYTRPSEEMFLADLVSPDSFDEAISKLKHALNVLNIAKPPKGIGPFGSFKF